jgi:hypothetical protein
MATPPTVERIAFRNWNAKQVVVAWTQNPGRSRYRNDGPQRELDQRVAHSAQHLLYVKRPIAVATSAYNVKAIETDAGV